LTISEQNVKVPDSMAAHELPAVRDSAAFNRAFALHARGVHAAAYAVLGDDARAQDVVQDVFLRLWRRPEAFDAARGGLGTYLRLMARSRAIDLWRESDARARAGDRLRSVAEREPGAPAPDPADRALEGSRREDLRAALSTLPHGQRTAVVLAYFGDLTAHEIAHAEGIPLGTAKSRVRLGLRKARETLQAAPA
jgi:RNA polymerase sigma-70 factor, ECF subfamily